MIDQALNDRLNELGLLPLVREASVRWLRGWLTTAEFICGCSEQELALGLATDRPHNRNCRGWMLARQFDEVGQCVERDWARAVRAQELLTRPLSWAARRQAYARAVEICGDGEWARTFYRDRMHEIATAEARDREGMAAAQARDDALLRAHMVGEPGEVRWVDEVRWIELERQMPLMPPGQELLAEMPVEPEPEDG